MDFMIGTSCIHYSTAVSPATITVLFSCSTSRKQRCLRNRFGRLTGLPIHQRTSHWRSWLQNLVL